MDRIWQWVLAGIVCVGLGAGGVLLVVQALRSRRASALPPVAEAPAPAPHRRRPQSLRSPRYATRSKRRRQRRSRPCRRRLRADSTGRSRCLRQERVDRSARSRRGVLVPQHRQLRRPRRRDRRQPRAPEGFVELVAGGPDSRALRDRAARRRHRHRASNANRYAPFVRFVESVDAAKAAAVYLRLYPMFQRAYEEQGYPGKHFNDRLVDVIDHLLQTPEPPAPPKVTLTEVKGPIKPARPWVAYEFADPNLEARSAGQKMLLRMGRRQCAARSKREARASSVAQIRSAETSLAASARVLHAAAVGRCARRRHRLAGHRFVERGLDEVLRALHVGRVARTLVVDAAGVDQLAAADR